MAVVVAATVLWLIDVRAGRLFVPSKIESSGGSTGSNILPRVLRSARQLRNRDITGRGKWHVRTSDANKYGRVYQHQNRTDKEESPRWDDRAQAGVKQSAYEIADGGRQQKD